MRILVINGPNLNMLGIREPDIYGADTHADLCAYVQESANRLGVEADIFQSNSEGAIVTRIQEALGAYDAIVINPAAYTHYSYAILDALKAVALPTVEVHLSDISKRESFRQVSVTRDACIAQISGKGFQGYGEAMDLLIGLLDQ
jgi:3-dehydroquinate dehydratase II